MSYTNRQLEDFVIESNKIEGIYRSPLDQEMEAARQFLGLPMVAVMDLEDFVSACQPGARLRIRAGMDVFVGNHTPPPGGISIETRLGDLLNDVNEEKENPYRAKIHPYRAHVRYETLHPFMDGNGRSGRILWAWQMLDQDIWPGLALRFLHAYYYQSLEHSR